MGSRKKDVPFFLELHFLDRSPKRTSPKSSCFARGSCELVKEFVQFGPNVSFINPNIPTPLKMELRDGFTREFHL